MFTPAVCLTCGAPVGDVADIFRHIREQRLREALKVSGELPEFAMSNYRQTVDMSDVFEKLRIVGCDYCRAVLATTLQWTDEF